jgi:hypothetical protein
MNRREFLAVSSTASLGMLAGGNILQPQSSAAEQIGQSANFNLLPFPKELLRTSGTLRLGKANYSMAGPASRTKEVASDSLNRFLPAGGKSISVRLGSLEEGYDKSWLNTEENDFIASEKTSLEASVLIIQPGNITVIGKGKWGMLYGVQTVNQLILEARRAGQNSIPCLRIRDWPDMRWRCLSPTLTWYSGWNRLEGYDLCNWSEGEWKWLADWSMLHKCNGWAVCMYGYWPFSLPGYEKETLDLDSWWFNPQTKKKELRRFTHKNIAREFYPEVIRYANERGVKVYAYIGKNSFNGCNFRNNKEIYAGGAAEMLPFAPGVDEYWDAFIGRILDLGFNGFVFEDPEANHVPNQNEQSYKTFWEPWASTYGFSSVRETNQNNPPLGVHIEYYTWLFREFDKKIQKHSKRLNRESEIYLISHILLARIIAESKTAEERQKWLTMVDEKHRTKVPFIIGEWSEPLYVEIFGKERVASLGGRGGSCTNAMRRIASVNNNWLHGGMGGDLAYERDCQKHIFEAGGFGAMGYIFEWTNTEVFGYLAAQHLWRNRGIPGVSNENQTGILYYAYARYYGDEVGHLAARAMDEGSDVNDAMVLEGVYGSQWPATGRVLHRDYQYLVVLADHSEKLAREAFHKFTGSDPGVEKPAYDQDKFVWAGYDPAGDKLFKSERLRWLWLSCRRSQEMCRAALAHRLAQRLIREGAPVGAVLDQFDRAIEYACKNQYIYQINYDDDYDWTDGLCYKVTERLEKQRADFLSACAGGNKVLKSWDFSRATDPLGWKITHDMSTPVIENGLLVSHATGGDPFIVQEQPLDIHSESPSKYVTIDMSSDKPGIVQIFWAAQSKNGQATDFSEQNSIHISVNAERAISSYRIPLNWEGTLKRFRFDFPDQARVKIRSITLTQSTETKEEIDRNKLVPEFARGSAESPVLFIPWEAQSDILPSKKKPHGLCLSTKIGFVDQDDFFRLGVVFTVQSQKPNGDWQTIFRRGVMRRTASWENWTIPLRTPNPNPNLNSLRLRFVTDSYTRAQDRNSPTWKWALWGQPQIVRIGITGHREVIFDFANNLDKTRAFTRLDVDGKEYAFTTPGEDATGATFKLLGPDAMARHIAQIQNERKDLQWVGGFKKWGESAPSQGSYTSYLGEVDSHWAYAAGGQVSWETDSIPKQEPTAIVFVGSTDFGPAKAELYANGERLLTFDTAIKENRAWKANGCELRYIHGAELPSRGISGVYILEVPASKITPGQPLHLAMKIPVKGSGWVMCHAFPNTLQAVRQQLQPPDPKVPAIAAFTPHKNDKFGTTIAEFSIQL